MSLSKNEIGTCNDCLFWLEDHSGYGECRRKAPRPMLRGPDGNVEHIERKEALWPRTGCEDWCGEYVEAER